MGFEDYAELSTSPVNGASYYAYVFMTQILFSYITNTTSQTIKVPMWLDVLGCALVQTEVPFVQGKLSYSFLTSLNFPASLTSNVPALGDYEFYLWKNDILAGVLNGYTIQTAPGAYDEQLGQMAYNLLVKFTSNLDVFPGWKGVDQLTSWTLKDVSAFAVSFLQLGQSTNNVGSPLVEIDFEVPINAPIFSVFADYAANSFGRYFRHARPYAGDANFLGYTLTHSVIKREIKTKIIPKFKQVDFYEYMEVFSLYLGKALQLANANSTQNNTTGAPLIWPLTWQDTAILLRQAIGHCWSPEILAGQFMAIDSAQATVQFTPFLWGTNCCPSKTVNSLVLPIVFLEGIRSLQGVSGDVDYTVGGKTKKGGRFVIMPVLGVYSFDVPSTVYEYEYAEGLFTPVYTVMAQTDIDLVDGYAPVGTSVVNLNSGQLALNLVIWNNFMNTIKANSCAFEALGSDKPPKTLHSLHLTNVCGNAATDGEMLKKLPARGCASKAHLPVRIRRPTVIVETEGKEKIVRTVVDPYSVVGTLEVVSQSQILKPIWSNWQNMIVLPTVRVQVSNTDYLTPTSYLSYGVGLNEPFSLIQCTSDGLNGSNPVEYLSARHDRWASAMVRPTMSDKTTLEEFLRSEALKGRGGSLGSMLGGLAGSFLEKWIPGASQIGSALGGLAPI